MDISAAKFLKKKKKKNKNKEKKKKAYAKRKKHNGTCKWQVPQTMEQRHHVKDDFWLSTLSYDDDSCTVQGTTVPGITNPIR